MRYTAAMIWLRFTILTASLLTNGIAAASPDRAAAGKGTVRYVTDGDTFRLTSGERIRIANIDAPETQTRQAKCRLEIQRGEAASRTARKLLEGRAVTFKRVGRSYNRTVARVSLNGQDLGKMLIAMGAARAWPKGQPKPNWCA